MALYELRDVVALVRHASTSTTYKPAFLKSLARLVQRRGEAALPLSAVGDEFVRLYWNQTVVFHLRQAAVLSKEPEVIKSIRTTADRWGIRDLARLPSAARDALATDMARILKINVLRAFHTSKPLAAPPLFTWEEGGDTIVLTTGAVEFIERQSQTLEVIANYWWASILEKVNVLAPAIIEKVSRDGARRSSLTKYLTILSAAGEDRCFYCGRPFSAELPVAVDHVLPWSFLLADHPWDLVLACVPCNSAKSDRLPDRAFIEKLANLNAKRRLPPSVSGLMLPSADVFRYYDAAISLEWPRFWAPV